MLPFRKPHESHVRHTLKAESFYRAIQAGAVGVKPSQIIGCFLLAGAILAHKCELEKFLPIRRNHHLAFIANASISEYDFL